MYVIERFWQWASFLRQCMLKPRRCSRIFRCRYLDICKRLRHPARSMIGGGGSTVSTLDTRHTRCVSVYATHRPTMRSEKGWSIACVKFITSVSGAESDDGVSRTALDLHGDC